ncbi:MAG: PQQ-binding-like beta-propeller repeat protein [Planctomycetaceae bacterium]|nr:PQQ-binding-like beta-propeller repeat protein [Planctomycetaceae bacterium]
MKLSACCVIFYLGLLTTVTAEDTINLSSNSIAKTAFRTPLSEVGQSGVCVSGDHLFLTVHKTLEGPLRGGFYFNSDVVGQCFDRKSGKQLWQVDLPGSYAGRVLESWNDSTSLTPVSNDKYVVFHNLNGMLGCYTHEGTLVWQQSWKAPDPDIKNCRMFLRNDSVIVALPSKKIAIEASKIHPKLPYYQIHCIQLSSGEKRWVSPILLHHATQYSIGQWKNQEVVVASMIDLSHWKFGQGRKGYLLSPVDGSVMREFKLPPAIPHQKNQLCDDNFLVTSSTGLKSTVFLFIDPDNGSITREFRIDQPDHYYAWNGLQYESTEFKPLFTDDRTLRGKGQPTPSTVHVVGKRIYFWRYDSSAIGCIETDTGKTTMLQAPLQVRADATAWLSTEFQFTKGIQNFSGKSVNMRVGTVRGIQRGGFGHTNPAWPILHAGKLHWMNGAGVLYVIDTTKPLSPEAFRWTSISSIGNSWTYGSPAVDNEAIYIRSQRELIRVNHSLEQ